MTFESDISSVVSGNGSLLADVWQWSGRTWQQWLTLSVKHIVLTVVILILALIVYRAVSKLLSKTVKRTHLDETTAHSLRVALRWVVLLLMVGALLQAWGVLENVWAAVTATVTLLAVGFIAVWSVLSNILCSIILLTTRPFRIGERIELPEVAGIGGNVLAMTLLFTLLESDDGSHIQIPNNMLFQKVVKRFPRSAMTNAVATPENAA